MSFQYREKTKNAWLFLYHLLFSNHYEL
jgi:hypothetical protein